MRKARAFALVVLVGCTPRRDPVDAKGEVAHDAGVVAHVDSVAPHGPDAAAPVVVTTDGALRDAAALATKWSAPIASNGRPALGTIGTRTIVVALDPKAQSMTARDAKDGIELWRTAAPANVTWNELEVGKTHAVAIDLDGAAMAVRLDKGATAWTQKDLYGLQMGRDGTGLVVSAKACGSQLVDPTSGRRFPAVFPGHVLHYRPMRTKDGVYTDNGHQRCLPPLHLLGQRGATPIAVVEDSKGQGAKLGAIDTNAQAPAFRWSVPFSSSHVFVAKIEERGAVVWTDESDLVVVRVDFGTGNVAWRRTLPHREHCAEPRRQVRMVDDVLVVQSCNTVMRLDPKSGIPLWTRDVGDALAALEGETMSSTDYEAFAEGGPRPFVVHWLDRASGTPKARVTIPETAHDVALAVEGALFLERKQTVQGVMGMIGLDGTERWRHGPALFGYTAVGRFVATGWERPRAGGGRHDHVLIDPKNGDVVGIAPETNHVVGSLADLLIAAGTDVVTGFVVPSRN